MHCTLALRLDPTDALVLYTRARSLMEDMKLSLALEDLSRASVLCQQQLQQNNKVKDNDNANDTLLSNIHDVMEQTLHKCETWMEDKEYKKFTKALEFAKRPTTGKHPMSILLFITTESINTIKSVKKSKTEQIESTNKLPSESNANIFECSLTSVSDSKSENFISLMTGTHYKKLNNNNSTNKHQEDTVPTLGHYLQTGTGVGTYDTAFCGKWYTTNSGEGDETETETSDPIGQHGFGVRLCTKDNSNSTIVCTTAIEWVQKRKNNNTPFFLVVSLTGKDIQENMQHVMKNICTKDAEQDMVVVTASIVDVTSSFSMEYRFKHDSTKSDPIVALRNNNNNKNNNKNYNKNCTNNQNNLHASILDILPTLLHCGGINQSNAQLRSFCETVSGYSGWYNPMPFDGRNLYYISIHFESNRRFEENEYVHDAEGKYSKRRERASRIWKAL